MSRSLQVGDRTLVVMILWGAGFAPVLAVAARLSVAIAMAPLVTALLATAAALISLGLSSGFGSTFVAVIALANIAAIAVLRRKGLDSIDTGGGLVPIGVAVAVGVLAGMALKVPPVSWDARSIWLFQSEWIAQGGDGFRAALENDAFAFAHRDYPKLVPAVGAIALSFSADDYSLGQFAFGVLSISGVTTLVAVVLWASRRLSPAVELPAVVES